LTGVRVSNRRIYGFRPSGFGVYSGPVYSGGIELPDGSPFVTMHCEQFPLLAVWANPAGPFICLEPWFGRTDDAGFSGTLAEKPGMQTLVPGGYREISYSIEFHPLSS